LPEFCAVLQVDNKLILFLSIFCPLGINVSRYLLAYILRQAFKVESIYKYTSIRGRGKEEDI